MIKQLKQDYEEFDKDTLIALLYERDRENIELDNEFKTLQVTVGELQMIITEQETRDDEIKELKAKKICPLLYGRPYGTNLCKEEMCMMWVDSDYSRHAKPYCTIAKGLGFLQNIGMGE